MTKTKNKLNTNNMVKAAFLTALSIILTRFLSIMVLPSVRLGLGAVPIFISGILFGPIVGGITGVAADLIGVLINPMGPAIHPGFTFSAFLNGAIPGIFVIYFRRRAVNGYYITFFRILIVESFLGILNGILLNTLWLTQLLGKGYLVLLPARVISALINIPVGATVIFGILKRFKNEIKS